MVDYKKSKLSKSKYGANFRKSEMSKCPKARKFVGEKKIPQEVREAVKYYFADFVRKRGGGGNTPQIRNPLFAEIFIRKRRGEYPPNP